MKTLFAVLSVLVVSVLHSSQSESFEGCFYRAENRTLAAGEKFTPEGRCVLATCLEDGIIAQLPCGLLSPQCKNPRIEHEDYTKPYPDCCAKVHCD